MNEESHRRDISNETTRHARKTLQHEGARPEDASLVERGMAFVKTLSARSHPTEGAPADKTFIDGLYGDP
jgi:hypothetical protein